MSTIPVTRFHFSLNGNKMGYIDAPNETIAWKLFKNISKSGVPVGTAVEKGAVVAEYNGSVADFLVEAKAGKFD